MPEGNDTLNFVTIEKVAYFIDYYQERYLKAALILTTAYESEVANCRSHDCKTKVRTNNAYSRVYKQVAKDKHFKMRPVQAKIRVTNPPK